jgi:hypothetical protein
MVGGGGAQPHFVVGAGQSGEGRSGRCPETHQGGFAPLDPPPKAAAFGIHSFGCGEGGALRDWPGLPGSCRRLPADPGGPGQSRNAPPSPQPTNGFQGPLPLAGVQRAAPSGGVQGQSPWPSFGPPTCGGGSPGGMDAAPRGGRDSGAVGRAADEGERDGTRTVVSAEAQRPGVDADHVAGVAGDDCELPGCGRAEPGAGVAPGRSLTPVAGVGARRRAGGRPRTGRQGAHAAARAGVWRATKARAACSSGPVTISGAQAKASHMRAEKSGYRRVGPGRLA